METIYQILIPQKRTDLSDRHCKVKTKNLVNRTVSFENELVPLNGRISLSFLFSSTSLLFPSFPIEAGPLLNTARRFFRGGARSSVPHFSYSYMEQTIWLCV